MAIQFNVATRNARLDTIESTNGTSCSLEIRSGTKPGACATATSGGAVLATINLPSDWMAAASSGAKAIAGKTCQPIQQEQLRSFASTTRSQPRTKRLASSKVT
jgi:hypothetical protein